jgi:glycosyltransferase involved in cell wall biosynthesis
LENRISFLHLDTADRRGLANIDQIDLTNIALAGYHCLKYLWLLLAKRPVIVYLPVAQNQLGFLRDCLFLIPARILKKSLVVHLHAGGFDTFYQDSSPIMRMLIRFALTKAHRAIVLGSSLVHTFHGVIPPERVRVIPNGTEDPFLAGRDRRRNGHGRTIIFLSTLMKEKGALDLLESLPRVAERVPDLQAVFAGEWFRQSVKDFATEAVRRMRLESRVKFLGPVVPPFKYELLNTADVFVLPSYSEGQPFAILEAMAAGLPIVSTRVGCIPDTVVDGVNGFLLEPGDVNALTEKLTLLLTDDHLREKMSDASRERFLTRYALENFNSRLTAMFNELLRPRCGENPRETWPDSLDTGAVR